MDDQIKAQWAEALEMLNKCDKSQRDHFVKMVLLTAKCFGPNATHAATLLVKTDETLVIVAANCDDMEMAEIVQHASALTVSISTADAPERSMYN
jgi:hypothetical protein